MSAKITELRNENTEIPKFSKKIAEDEINLRPENTKLRAKLKSRIGEL